MFDIFPQLLSSVASFLFPLFASYKALKTSDRAQLAPWLMYWVVLACALLVESWTEWILVWVPFYSYLRLFFHLYLVLPQTQGARTLYLVYLEPFLAENESDIDSFIATLHDRLKTAGVFYLRRAIEYIRVHGFGLSPNEELFREEQMMQSAAASPQEPQTYTASLLSRFAMPSGPKWPQGGGDFYGLLAGAVSSATGLGAASAASAGESRGAGANMTASGTLIPDHLRQAHPSEQANFLSAQRDRLQILMGALDREAAALQVPGAFNNDSGSDVFDGASGSRPASGLSKSRSENDFEKIDAESGAEEDAHGVRRRGAGNEGGWMPSGWGGSGSGARSSGYEQGSD